MGVVAGAPQLTVEVVLHEVDEGYVVVVLCAVAVDAVAVVDGHLAPLRHVGGAELVAQAAESGIGTQPFYVAVDEVLVGLATEDGGLLLGIDFAHEVHLALGDALVVNLLEGVELAAERLVVLLAGRLAKPADVREVEVEGMEGEGRVGIVGI